MNGGPSHLPHPGFGMSGAGIMLNREPPRLLLINALMFCVKEFNAAKGPFFPVFFLIFFFFSVSKGVFVEVVKATV